MCIHLIFAGIVYCTNNIYERLTKVASADLPKSGIVIKHMEKLTNFSTLSVETALRNTKASAKGKLLVEVSLYFNYLVSVTAGGPRIPRGHM